MLQEPAVLVSRQCRPPAHQLAVLLEGPLLLLGHLLPAGDRKKDRLGDTLHYITLQTEHPRSQQSSWDAGAVLLQRPLPLLPDLLPAGDIKENEP